MPTESSAPGRRQVFVVGMNGSGTTLLLDCLSGHSELFGFRAETKVLPYFIEREASYGNLSDDRNFARLWLDLRGSLGRHRWPAGAHPSAIANWGSRPRNAARAFDAMLSALAERDGKRVWCEKTPMYVHHIGTLSSAFPDALFIHVIRDGRDCAASFHRRWKFNPVRTAFRWKRAVRAGREGGGRIGPRYMEVRYEALTAEPETSLRAICGFIGVGFEPGILQPARLRPQMTGSNRDVIAANDRRASRYFTAATLRQLEEVAGRALEQCGYSLEHVAGDADPPGWKLRYWEFTDDGRRLWAAVKRAGSVPGSERLRFLSRRVKGAIRQKRTLQ